MREYKISFRPTFHDNVNLCLEIDGDYGVFTLESPPYGNRPGEILSAKEVSPELIEAFNKNISAVESFVIQSLDDCGRDGMVVECFYRDDERSHRFSVWSPRGDEYRAQLVFINSVYDLARRTFTDEQPARLLENVGRYFD